jgi:hypothetical protein
MLVGEQANLRRDPRGRYAAEDPPEFSQTQPPSEPVNCGSDPRLREWWITAATWLLALALHLTRPP